MLATTPYDFQKNLKPLSLSTDTLRPRNGTVFHRGDLERAVPRLVATTDTKCRATGAQKRANRAQECRRRLARRPQESLPALTKLPSGLPQRALLARSARYFTVNDIQST